jgi:plasmid stabilization system protein ParE
VIHAVLSLAALADLERMREFLAAAAIDDPDEVVERVLDALELLEHHPNLGRPADAGLRELVISHGRTGYLALYRFDEARSLVRVLRLRHQREAGYRG